jgi:hypothetical protein
MKRPSKFEMTIQGCGYLEGYGHNFGYIPAITLILIAYFGGSADFWWIGSIFAGITAAIFIPAYLDSAYARAKMYYDNLEQRDHIPDATKMIAP